MTGENIICFAKDWSEDPTSNNHVMRLLARENRVLWINSIATRVPSLASGADRSKILRRLGAIRQSARQVAENLWVYTPLVLPFPHNRLAVRLNRTLLRSAIGSLRRRLEMRDFQLWSFLPNAADYVGSLGESLVVYYCVDEWSKFSYLDGEKIAAAERRLCSRADLVFATSHRLAESKRELNPETHLALHGVDYELFSAAMRDDVAIAPDLAALPQPVIGFFGLLHQWRIDVDLLAYVAERRPGWSIALIGKVDMDVSRLERLPNVHLFGRRPYADLPSYCKGFSVGIIPYVVNELTANVNPIKLREYLSAGLPVVSTDLQEVRDYSHVATVARSYEEFLAGIDQALLSNSPEERRRRSLSMQSETWEQKVADLGACVERAKSRKRSQ